MPNPFVWPPVIDTSTGVNPTPTGPGGALVPGFSAFWPDAPPEVPHACDDEFTGSTLDPKWTVFNHAGAVFTIGVNTTKRMASFAVPAISGGVNQTRMCSIVQPVPATEWCAIARVANLFNNASGGAETAALEMGMCVQQGVGVADDLYTFGTFQFDNSGGAMNAQGMRVRTFSAYNAATAQLEVGIDVRSWIRMRCNVATMRVETSPDGVQWFRLWNGVVPFAIAYFGLSFGYTTGGTWTTASQGQGYAKYFRVASGAGSSGLTAYQIGRYV